MRHVRLKYEGLIKEHRKYYEKVKFVNLSVSLLGVFSESSLDFIEMSKDLDDKYRKSLMTNVESSLSGK